MQIIKTTTIGNSVYTITFNGSNTYFVCNEFDCEGHFTTLRKAENKLKKIASYYA